MNEQYCWLLECVNTGKAVFRYSHQVLRSSQTSLSLPFAFLAMLHHSSTSLPFCPAYLSFTWFIFMSSTHSRKLPRSSRISTAWTSTREIPFQFWKSGWQLVLLEKELTLCSVKTESLKVCPWSCDQLGYVEHSEKHLESSGRSRPQGKRKPSQLPINVL